MSSVADAREVAYLQVIAWRYDTAVAAGLRHEDAATFAYSGIDIEALRKLADAGCPPEVITLILF
jgi:hypothetical protein